jgi:hypothetical protein
VLVETAVDALAAELDGELHYEPVVGSRFGPEASAVSEAIDAVLENIRTAYDTGVTGVPSYLLAGRFTIPGAQPPEVLSRFIERALLRLSEDNNDSV